MQNAKRLRHGIEVRERALELFEAGFGKRSVSSSLGIPVGTVEKWLCAYKAVGPEGPLNMGRTHNSYSFETKLAFARMVVDGGAILTDAMVAYGVVSRASAQKWCKAYREGGEEALKPKPKGRPKGSPAKQKAPMTREEELEIRVRKLEAENAYLKKIGGPEGGRGASNRVKASVVASLSGGHSMNDLLECAGLARSSYYYAMAHPKQPTRPELWEKVAEVFSRTPNGCGHRQIAMCLRAEDGVAIAEKTVLKIMSEMGIRCGIRKETDYHRYSSYRGLVGKTFENLIGRDFKADAPWQKMGTDVTEFKQAWGKAYFAPVYDFGSREIVAWSTSMSPNMAQQFDVLDQLVARMPDGAHPVLHSDMGWQYQNAGWVDRLADAGIAQSMSRKGNCIDNGATEQVFGHIKDEFFRGRRWPSFEEFKRDLDAYVIHWNTRRRQVKLEGLTPEEFRNQSLAA